MDFVVVTFSSFTFIFVYIFEEVLLLSLFSFLCGRDGVGTSTPMSKSRCQKNTIICFLIFVLYLFAAPSSPQKTDSFKFVVLGLRGIFLYFSSYSEQKFLYLLLLLFGTFNSINFYTLFFLEVLAINL